MKDHFFLITFLALAAIAPANADEKLAPATKSLLAGTHGKFDFIKVDSSRHRLLACHTGNASLDIVDEVSGHLVKSIPTGAAQGVSIDARKGRYFVSTSKPPKLVIIDSSGLRVVGEVPLPGPADINAYDPKSGRVFVCNDDKPEAWVVDPDAKKILSTIIFPGGGMEDLAFDSQGTFLFQNLKDTSELAKLDVSSASIVAHWPTLPAEKPHGLALVSDHAALIAGGTGKLVLLDLASGHVLASADIAPKVDEIAYDEVSHRVFCASGLGTISIVSVDGTKLVPLGHAVSETGDHSIAVDSLTHQVWIVYAKGTEAWAQSFTAK